MSFLDIESLQLDTSTVGAHDEYELTTTLPNYTETTLLIDPLLLESSTKPLPTAKSTTVTVYPDSSETETVTTWIPEIYTDPEVVTVTSFLNRLNRVKSLTSFLTDFTTTITIIRQTNFEPFSKILTNVIQSSFSKLPAFTSVS